MGTPPIARYILTDEYTHNGMTMTGYEWAKHLEISNETWRRRYYQYRDTNHYMLFFTKQEMNAHMAEVRSRAGHKAHKSKLRSIRKEEPVGAGSIDPDDPDQIKNMLGLIAAVIDRQKRNLVKISKDKMPSDQDILDYYGARNFLTDSGGNLSFYLDVSYGIDKESAKSTLRKFALGFPELHPADPRNRR